MWIFKVIEMDDNCTSEQAIMHIITTEKHWEHETDMRLIEITMEGKEKAFSNAVEHVRNQHKPDLTDEEIEKARSICLNPDFL